MLVQGWVLVPTVRTGADVLTAAELRALRALLAAMRQMTAGQGDVYTRLWAKLHQGGPVTTGRVPAQGDEA